MKIGIVGGGIGGCTLAFFLKKYGYDPVVIESVSGFERVGYLLGLRETGMEVIKKMGLPDEIKKYEIPFTKTTWKDIRGRIIKTFDVNEAISEVQGIALNRADLHAVLVSAVKDRVDFRFGREIREIDEAVDRKVSVRYADGKTETFDLLIGADGFRSDVRRLVFGDGFTRYLGQAFFAFIVPDRTKLPIVKTHETTSVRGTDFFISYGLFSQDEKEVGGYVIYREKHFRQLEQEKRRQYLLDHFAKYDANFRHVLETMQDDDFIYHGDLSQVVMPKWSKGRVCLIGDAAYCLTLASGLGASMAMAGAYMLANGLRKKAYEEAFSGYENRLRPDIERLQDFGRNMARFIVGEGVLPYGVVNMMIRHAPEPVIRQFLLRQSLKLIALD